MTPLPFPHFELLPMTSTPRASIIPTSVSMAIQHLDHKLTILQSMLIKYITNKLSLTNLSAQSLASELLKALAAEKAVRHQDNSIAELQQKLADGDLEEWVERVKQTLGIELRE